MADKIIALVGPAAMATSATTVYTNVAGDEGLLRHARFVNTSGSTQTVNLSVGADSAATRLVSGKQIPANDFLDVYFSPGVPLTGTTTLQAFASATSVTIALYGTRRYV